MLARINWTISCLILLHTVLQAQNGKAPAQLKLALHHGFIIPHSRDIVNVSQSKPRGLHLEWARLLQRSTDLERNGLLARRGVALYWVDFDKPGVLGHSLALVPFVEPIVRPWKKWQASMQFGLGLAYVSRHYHPTENPQNLFFSLPVNFWVMLNPGFHYQWNERWQASATFNYNHISNGGMKNPNKGMNFPTWNVGIRYALQPLSLRKPDSIYARLAPTGWYATVSLVASIKNVAATTSHPRTVPARLLGGQALYGWRAGRLSNFSAGTEWIHDGYVQEQDKRASRNRSAWKGAFLAGYELKAGRVQLGIHAAPYLYAPARGNDDRWYQRYSLAYRFGRHLLIGGSLKAHRHVADVADLRLGWTW